MKKLFYIIIALGGIINEHALAQVYLPENNQNYSYRLGCTDDLINIPMSSNHNGIVDITYKSKDGSKTSTKVQYFDGLGNLMEDIAVGASPTGGDIVVWHEYNGNGKPTKNWLPAVIATAGKEFHPENTVCHNSIESNQNDGYPYEKIIYEHNPLGRVVEQIGPGTDWHSNGKSKKTDYLTNVENNPELNCLKIQIASSSDNVSIVGNYPTGSLRVSKITNEDGEIYIEFRDNLDRLILSRHLMQYGDESLDTYYVYDGFNLRRVFPPNASSMLHMGTISTSFLDKYTYGYRYDERNRLISKQIPGSNPVLMAYDMADRLIFSQDGEQRKKGKCTFHLYDVYGRECVMGECLQTLSTSGHTINDYIRCDYDKTGSYMGYTLSGIEINQPQILKVNYYDSYEFLDNDSLKYVDDNTFGLVHGHPRSLLTGSISARLGNSIEYDTSSFFYDEYSRLLQSHRTNHLGGYEHEYIEYSFTGEVLRHRNIHTITGRKTIVQEYQNSYDDEGRLMKKTYSLNHATPIILADNKYDKLGRLESSKTLSNENLKKSYEYNVRSWISSITSGTFSEKINYNQTSSNATPRYGGNISEIIEKHIDNGSTSIDNLTYFYDKNARLLSTQHENNIAGDVFGTSYEYDLNGNITHILRNGLDETGGKSLLDDLTLTYDGDLLVKATNDAPSVNLYNSMHFSDASDEPQEYFYDANGNLTKDSNKKILSIQYNVLNLPRKISLPNGAFEEMTYNIDGEKLRVKKKDVPQSVRPGTGELMPDPNPDPMPGPHSISTNSTKSPSSPNPTKTYTLYPTTDYCGNIIYKDDILSRINIEGGYITFKEDGTPAYHFYLNDHLGNNRLVVSATGAVEQQNFFYPFGASRSDSKNNGQTQPYKYNGKELDTYENLYLYDYGARLYDPILCRFMTKDPLAEEDYGTSSYVYCKNNPIRYIDPTG